MQESQNQIKPLTITVGDSDRIDAYGETAKLFFNKVLSMDSSRVLITDESRLSDFQFSGHFDIAPKLSWSESLTKWDVFVCQKINEVFGIKARPQALLVDLFEEIGRQGAGALPRGQHGSLH